MRSGSSILQVLSNSILTQDRLLNRGLADQSCFFFVRITEKIQGICGSNVIKANTLLVTDESNGNSEWNDLIKHTKRDGLAGEVQMVFICATVHYLWMERNRRKHSSKRRSAAEHARFILGEVKGTCKLDLPKYHILSTIN